ncbi:MAG: cbb3-type cytochrome oxidase assembly protein CcoS [Pseudomonadales bacterium]
MPSLYLLIPIALLLVFVAAVLYWWAVRSGQYDDLDREADRILFEDDCSKRNRQVQVVSHKESTQVSKTGRQSEQR